MAFSAIGFQRSSPCLDREINMIPITVSAARRKHLNSGRIKAPFRFMKISWEMSNSFDNFNRLLE